jgi:enediyne biosynthesis protein E4
MLYFFSSKSIFFSCCLIWIISGCNPSNKQQGTTLFTKLSAEETGIDFTNTLEYNNVMNPYTRHNFYNGGGVAVGDLNNDNLPDLFFTGNLVPNKLYINKGNFQFEDVSDKAHISSKGLWYTGVTLVDINADGWLDIYLCRADDLYVGWQGNELYINNGDLTFSESSAKYGLSFTGFSTQSVFFDLDNDSDLDCYLLNSTKQSSVNKFYPSADQRKIMAREGSKLFLNENNHFTDITEKSGIYGSRLELGLGVSISDINKDGWQDIYVSNDYFERDYLYLNNHNTTFTECLDKYIQEISLFSMGADIADINNDAYTDIYVTDMLPETEGRIKAKTIFETWEKYLYTVNAGYHHQFLRNVLQLNRGPIPMEGRDSVEHYFSEIGRLADVHASDWSWGALIADLNNDGFKDIFVSNGMGKDVTDQDFIQFMASDSVQSIRDWKKIVDLIPSEPLPKSVFENNGDLTFSKRSKEWGFQAPTFSNGSVYADLDNDGDLDIVTNNINDHAGVYRNNSTELLPDNRWLEIALEGEDKNKFGIGTKVTAYFNNTLCFVEQHPARGFQSCVDHTLHIGLGKIQKIDSVRIEWPDQRAQTLNEVMPNQRIIVKQTNATKQRSGKKINSQFSFRRSKIEGLNFIHKEDSFVDFNKDKLLYYMLSTSGPKADIADVNGDGRDDIYFCGAKGQAGALYTQQAFGKFIKHQSSVFEADKNYEDTECMFFDADGDNDQDLFVCSGGNIYPAASKYLQNRIYVNNGKGVFSTMKNLPESIDVNSGTVCSSDFDLDGDLDLFVGGRSKADQYGYPCSGQVWANDGKGFFTNVTDLIAPELQNAGMITCGQWLDYDQDQKPDLVVAGEYMPLRIFHNEGNKLKEITYSPAGEKTNGWWNCMAISDVNNDNFPDIIIGNHGLNSRFKAKQDEPITLLSGDLDNNGTLEQVVCTFNEGKQYPMVLRHDLVGLLPSLKKKFLKYADYKEKTIDQIFTPEQLLRAVKQDAYQLQTCIMLNNTKGGFDLVPLPVEAQFSPVYAVLACDFDNDGNKDILLGGNFFESKPEAGIHNGSYGVHLKGNGNGSFNVVPLYESGFFVKGAVRDIEIIEVNGKRVIVVTKNNEAVELFDVGTVPLKMND